MAFPRKKQKLNGFQHLPLELQRSLSFLDSNSNTPNHHETFSDQSSQLSFFSVSNSLMAGSNQSMNGGFIQNKQNQDNSDQVGNILKTEQIDFNQDNDIEMRINKWLDSQNIVMVRPEDIIHDFYHKMRSFSIKKMETELNEQFLNNQSIQTSLNDFGNNNLDYPHCKPSKNDRKALKRNFDNQQTLDQIINDDSSSSLSPYSSSSPSFTLLPSATNNRQQSNQLNQQKGSTYISSLLQRRQKQNRLSILGTETNNILL